MLQIQHRQRREAARVATGKGLLQQGLRFVQLGLGSAGFAGQQTPQARLSARRGFCGFTVRGFGLFQLLGVRALHPDIGQPHLRFGVTQIRQCLIVTLCGGGVAVFQGFIGQPLIGQARATGECEGQQAKRWPL